MEGGDHKAAPPHRQRQAMPSRLLFPIVCRGRCGRPCLLPLPNGSDQPRARGFHRCQPGQRGRPPGRGICKETALARTIQPAHQGLQVAQSSEGLVVSFAKIRGQDCCRHEALLGHAQAAAASCFSCLDCSVELDMLSCPGVDEYLCFFLRYCWKTMRATRVVCLCVYRGLRSVCCPGLSPRMAVALSIADVHSSPTGMRLAE